MHGNNYRWRESFKQRPQKFCAKATHLMRKQASRQNLFRVLVPSELQATPSETGSRIDSPAPSEPAGR